MSSELLQEAAEAFRYDKPQEFIDFLLAAEKLHFGRISALEAALKPFAEIAPAYDGQTCWPPRERADDRDSLLVEQWGEHAQNVRSIFVSDLRRAKAALEG